MAGVRPLMAPINETEHSCTRVSREGKRITYNLKVIQQPERARACGAGAKSSADRRPVDPPPVVELRVFESELDNDMNKTDITFAYNANFFLFATLENARPIAQVRNSGTPPICPVLTGVPVAGIAYLDRPAQAGYFIFPDLSVRHEGFYRLNFNLYEEVKDPKDIDKDAGLPVQPMVASNKPGAPKAFLNFRLEVKSTPFQVYSAKKFPGLATSTSLSRVVAEQGCRVRIRRDVRMRRRGEKSGKDYGDYEEDRYGRSPRYTTPTPVERPRSASNSTVEAPYPYPGQTPRRDSTHEYPGYQAHHSRAPPPPAPSTPYQHPHALQHAPPPPPPPAPASTSAAPGYLSFGSASATYQTPQLPAAPPPPPSHSIYPSGPSTPTSAYTTQPQLPHSRQPSNASDHEPAPQSYPTRSHHLPSILNPAPVDPPAYGGPSPSEVYPPATSTASVPPRPHTPLSSIMLPPISSLGQFAGSAPASDISQQRRPSYYPIETSLSKRTHEDSFGNYETHTHKSIRSENDYAGAGHQPTGPVSGKIHTFIEPDTSDWERPQMEYRRADGRMSSKAQLAV
ncbi:hypothetical protein TMatcc_006018 [Talaromyces marneffei ATCC 18224]|uniref:Developmental and secondary metabolism regulator veA n=1 Tax=Talaromyces marneffei (strain ATCC 18224 / CBS 334.59 / QM 7333) TaxID=441960 RepID=B6Q8E4_TALMQ|nr:sexual development activator VeA [Talaromyces marneffei ATCC 18224]KAE8554446.1 hypothetical protein EYB25_002985 [Talaromyces marneffei]